MSTSGKKKELAEESVIVRQVILVNKLGMHARPSATFVKLTAQFQSEILVEKDGEKVNGKSIMGLMMLAAGCGSKLKIHAKGPDAEKAVHEIESLINRKFDEEK